MRKYLMLILALVLAIACCFAFASCSDPGNGNGNGNGGGGNVGPITPGDAEEDPSGTASNAIGNAMGSFMKDETGISSVVENAMKNGSVALRIEGDSLLGMLGMGEGASIEEVIYLGAAGNRFVSDTTVIMNGETYAARLFLDQDGIAINSPAIFGSDNTYALLMDALVSDDGKALLAALIGEELTQEASDLLDTYAAEYAKLFDGASSDTASLDLSAVLDVLEPVVTTGQKANADGESVDCVIITYSIDNNDLVALCNALVDLYAEALGDVALEYVFGDVSLDELKTQIEASLTESMSYMALDLDLSFYIDSETSTAVCCQLAGTVAYDYDIYSYTEGMNFEVLMSDSKLQMAVTTELDGEEMSYSEILFTKEEESGVITYGVSASSGRGNDATVPFALELAYTRATGDFTMNVTAASYSDGGYGGDYFASPEATYTTLTIGGNVSKTATSASLAVTSITYGDMTISMNVSLTFTVGAVMPSTPTDAISVLEMNEEQLGALMVDVMNSPLGQLLGSIMGSDQGPDAGIYY